MDRESKTDQAKPGLLRRIGRALTAWLSMGKCCSSCDMPFMRPPEDPPEKSTKPAADHSR